MNGIELLLAGIRQFGLAADGSDLRDIQAAFTRLKADLEEKERLEKQLRYEANEYLKSLKNEQAHIKMLEEWRNQFDCCMCGSPMQDHDIGSGHSPVSMYDYSLGQAQEENKRLRAALAMSNQPCAYCSLPADEWAKCKSGFPGCDRADDAMGCPELGARLIIDEVVKAWESLPEGRHPIAAIQSWLIETMKPVIDKARKVLG